jgi:hypothetical protein
MFCVALDGNGDEALESHLHTSGITTGIKIFLGGRDSFNSINRSFL